MKQFIFFLLFSTFLFSQNIGNADAVENILDNLHLYASEAKAKKYMALFSDDAVFLGTDINERWTKSEFNKYATTRMATGKGWTYLMIQRNTFISDDGKTAWFDEILYNKGSGEFRGTGSLKIVNTEWKITQYNLLLPIPNDLMNKYAKEIKDFYGQK
jgi:hypothetical protein